MEKLVVVLKSLTPPKYIYVVCTDSILNNNIHPVPRDACAGRTLFCTQADRVLLGEVENNSRIAFDSVQPYAQARQSFENRYTQVTAKQWWVPVAVVQALVTLNQLLTGKDDVWREDSMPWFPDSGRAKKWPGR